MLTTLETQYVDASRRGDQNEVRRIGEHIDQQQHDIETRLRNPKALAAAAKWYAETLGWPIFPCQPGGKVPATGNGCKDATTDLGQIDVWWGRNPRYNVAVATGHLFDVIDLDGPEGVINMGPFIDSDDFDPIAVALTPHGRHYFVPPTGGGNKVSVAPQVDYRGRGGYVVVAPSSTPVGSYRWAHDSRP